MSSKKLSEDERNADLQSHVPCALGEIQSARTSSVAKCQSKGAKISTTKRMSATEAQSTYFIIWVDANQLKGNKAEVVRRDNTASRRRIFCKRQLTNFTPP